MIFRPSSAAFSRVPFNAWSKHRFALQMYADRPCGALSLIADGDPQTVTAIVWWSTVSFNMDDRGCMALQATQIRNLSDSWSTLSLPKAETPAGS